MQLAYELLPVWAGQDENLPTAIPKLRHRSRVYLLDEMHAGGHDLQSCRESLAKLQRHGSNRLRKNCGAGTEFSMPLHRQS